MRTPRRASTGVTNDVPTTRVAVVSLVQLADIAQPELLQTRRSGRPLSLLSIAVSCSGRPVEPSRETKSPFLEIFTTTCRNLACSLAYLSADGGLQEILLPSVGARGALRMAERLRTACNTWEAVETARGPRCCKVSIGSVTTRTGRTTYAAMRSRADAKRDDAAQGRGRFSI